MDRTSFIAALALAALASVVPGLGTGNASAQAAAKPDLAKAKQIAETVCAACHGADGNSAVAANPNLAGQGAEYISRQLAHFKAGIRMSPIMQPIAQQLSDADMVALGVYFSQQKAKTLAAKDPQLVAAGQRLFRGGDTASGVPACAACHSPTGAGIPKNFPKVSGQYADYTYAQLKAFKSGERGNDAGGKDADGRIMAAIAQKLDDTQMKALADYAAGLR
jgi:cytochrome c553